LEGIDIRILQTFGGYQCSSVNINIFFDEELEIIYNRLREKKNELSKQIDLMVVRNKSNALVFLETVINYWYDISVENNNNGFFF
jgi:hypothetical protein